MRIVVRQSLLIAAKDTRSFLKDRFAVGFSFLFPFLFVIGFTLALGDQGPDDDPVVVVVASQEETGVSQQIISGLRSGSGGAFEVRDYNEALAAVEAGDLGGFVSFPPNFTDALTQGETAVIEVVVGAESPELRAILGGFAETVVSELTAVNVAAGVLNRLVEAGHADVGGIDFEALNRGPQPQIGYQIDRVGDVVPIDASNFTLPGYLTMFVFFAAALSAEAIARERQSHTLERLMSNGTRRESIILGKFIGTSYRGVAQLVVMWTVGVLAFGVDLGVSPAAVILISVLMALASAAFGVLLASFVSGVQATATAGVLVSLMLAPLGGCWWPLFITPQWMQSLAKLTPHGWANTAFNRLMLFGAEFGDVTAEMVALLVFGVAFLAVALWRFRLSAE